MELDVPTYSQLHFSVQGAGDPVIALHGFGATQYSWRFLVPEVVKSNQLFLFDLKGHGLSTNASGDDYGLSEQANLIYQCIQSRNLFNVALIGHSYGGGIALLIALKSLSLSDNRISKLILIDTIAYPQRFPLFIRILRTSGLNHAVLKLIPIQLSVRFLLKLAFKNRSKITPDMIHEYAKYVSTSLIKIAQQMVPANIDQIIGEYSNIKIPCTIIWGDNDRIIPLRSGRRLAETLNTQNFILVPNCGHVPHEERPNLVIHRILQAIKN